MAHAHSDTHRTKAEKRQGTLKEEGLQNWFNWFNWFRRKGYRSAGKEQEANKRSLRALGKARKRGHEEFGGRGDRINLYFLYVTLVRHTQRNRGGEGRGAKLPKQISAS